MTLCAYSDGNTDSAPAVSEGTKQAVVDYKIRWDKKVETMQEMAAVLVQHLEAGRMAPQTEDIKPADKAKFTQQRLQSLIGRVFAGRVNEAALEEDLQRIINKFEQKDKALRPNMSAALTANFGMASTPSGNVVVGDRVIDTSSLIMGVTNAVVMNAKAGGEDPEAAVNYLRAEMLKKLLEKLLYLCGEKTGGEVWTVPLLRPIFVRKMVPLPKQVIPLIAIFRIQEQGFHNAHAFTTRRINILTGRRN